MASCARIREYILEHHLTPHRGRILSHGCHNVLIENSRKVSNCWWLWALSVWKLFRACKNASINKHLNSYAFSVPMKAILAGCGGHTFNPSRPAKAGESLWDQPGLYCEFCPGQPFTPTPIISLSYLSCSGSVSVCRFSFSVWGLSISYNDLHFLCTRGGQKWHFSGLHVKPSKAEALGKAELEQPFCLWFNKWFIAFLMALEVKSHKLYFMFNPCF